VSILFGISKETFDRDSNYLKKPAFELIYVAQNNILTVFESKCVTSFSDCSLLGDGLNEIGLKLCGPNALILISLILKTPWTLEQSFFRLILSIQRLVEFH